MHSEVNHLRSFKVGLNLFQSFALGFRQKERHSCQVDEGETAE
jgi:hypothetical protein